MPVSPSQLALAAAAFDDLWMAYSDGFKTRHIDKAARIWQLFRVLEIECLEKHQAPLIVRFYAQHVSVSGDWAHIDNVPKFIDFSTMLTLYRNEKGYEVILNERPK